MDTRPAQCRFRLQEEGKPYPKSACVACGKTIITGLGNHCAVTVENPRINIEWVYAGRAGPFVVRKSPSSRWFKLTHSYDQDKTVLEFVLSDRDARDMIESLSGAATPTPCKHEWTDARNEVVKSGEICLKCGTIRAGNTV